MEEDSFGIKKCCETCMHFNPLPGLEKTGVCDANELNKRSGVPIVLTSSEEVCWEWEKEKGVILN